MKDKIALGIFVAIIAIVALMLITTGEEIHETEWADGDADGAWGAQISVKYVDGTEKIIPIDGFSPMPQTVYYDGGVVASFGYALTVTASDPEEFYTEVELRHVDTPYLCLAMFDLDGGTGLKVLEYVNFYPMPSFPIPLPATSAFLLSNDFAVDPFNEVDPGTYDMTFYISDGGYEYKLPGGNWTTITNPDEIWFEVTVEHGGGFTISFNGFSGAV